MRLIRQIIIHCTATECGRDYAAAEIAQWHKARGWQDIGYHYVIHLDGSIERGRDEQRVGAHCVGHNVTSIGVAYIGGLQDGKPADTRTAEQKQALKALIDDLLSKYPSATVHGHCEYNRGKACPCFDVSTEFDYINSKCLEHEKQSKSIRRHTVAVRSATSAREQGSAKTDET